MLLQFCLYIAITVAPQASMARGVAEIYVGRTPEWQDCIARAIAACCRCSIYRAQSIVGLSVACVYFVLSLFLKPLYTAKNIIFTILAFLFNISIWALVTYMSIFIITVIPVVILERKNAFGAVVRCWELAKGQRIFLLAGSFVCFTGLALFRWFILYALGVGSHSFIGICVANLLTLVTLPIGTIFVVLLYLNIRMVQEGMDAERLAEELDDETMMNASTVPYGMEDGYDIGEDSSRGDQYNLLYSMDDPQNINHNSPTL